MELTVLALSFIALLVLGVPVAFSIGLASVATIMAAYNEVDGQPPHANKGLLDGLLRGQLGFRGMIVSDYFGIAELNRKHHVVADLRETGRRALRAGVDIELPGDKEPLTTLTARRVHGRWLLQDYPDELTP